MTARTVYTTASNVMTRTPEGGTEQADGVRHYLLGPGADERLLYQDGTSEVFFPHVDMLGSTVALSQGGEPR